MNEDTFNLEVRKFLKKVGITSQREIERAVTLALDTGRLNGDETLDARVTLEVPALDVRVQIDDTIALEED
jgi:ribosomal protein L1